MMCREMVPVTAASRSTNPRVVGLIVSRSVVISLEFGYAAEDRRARQIGGCGDERDTTSSQSESLGSGSAAPCPLVQQRGQGFILPENSRNQCGICHNDIRFALSHSEALMAKSPEHNP